LSSESNYKEEYYTRESLDQPTSERGQEARKIARCVQLVCQQEARKIARCVQLEALKDGYSQLEALKEVKKVHDKE